MLVTRVGDYLVKFYLERCRGSYQEPALMVSLDGLSFDKLKKLSLLYKSLPKYMKGEAEPVCGLSQSAEFANKEKHRFVTWLHENGHEFTFIHVLKEAKVMPEKQLDEVYKQISNNLDHLEQENKALLIRDDRKTFKFSQDFDAVHEKPKIKILNLTYGEGIKTDFLYLSGKEFSEISEKICTLFPDIKTVSGGTMTEFDFNNRYLRMSVFFEEPADAQRLFSELRKDKTLKVDHPNVAAHMLRSAIKSCLEQGGELEK